MFCLLFCVMIFRLNACMCFFIYDFPFPEKINYVEGKSARIDAPFTLVRNALYNVCVCEPIIIPFLLTTFIKQKKIKRDYLVNFQHHNA